MRLIATLLNATIDREDGRKILDSYDSFSTYIFLSLSGFLAAFTIVANICTILLLMRYHPMQKSISNLYILSLSFADLGIGILVFILAIGRMLGERLMSSIPWLCDVWQVADFVVSTVSLYSICAIAFDRVWNLEKPLRVFKRSRRLARKLIFCIWLLPLLVWLPYYFLIADHSNRAAMYGMSHCTSSYAHPILVPFLAVPILYIPAIALVTMFVRISVVVHGHLSFLREHSNNPLGNSGNNTSGKGSKESTPYTRTPEQTKKFSDSSQTSGYTSMRSPRSASPRFPRAELTPLSEERSSGRERSFSEQLPGRIAHFDVDSSNHLRVKSCASNPTRRESIKVRQIFFSQRTETSLTRNGNRESRCSLSRSSFARLSFMSRNGSGRFSVIAIPSNLTDLLQREGVSQQVRAAKAVALILFCFLLCWLPFLVLWPIKIYCRSCVPDTAYNISIWLNYLSSALNPLLYTLSSPRVRVVLASYGMMLCSRRRSNVKQSLFAKSGTFV